MKEIRLLFLFLVFSLLNCSAALAGNSVSLKLDRETAAITDTITMKVVVQGTIENVAEPVLHNMDGFTVSSSGRSSSFQMINNAVTSSVEYNYLLIPLKTGSFSLGPAIIDIDGKSYTTNVVGLNVTKASVQNGKEKGDVFLLASISSKDVLPEQPLVYTLKLYHRIPVRNISLQLPESENFEIKQAGKHLEYESRYNNSSYRVAELLYILQPLKKGKVEIPSAVMRMEIIKQRSNRPGSMFNDPFFSFGRATPYSVISESFSLNVKDLPENGRPADFSGLVGEYQMEVSLDPVSLKSGESSTLTAVITGQGNVQRIPSLKLKEISGCRIYTDEPLFESSVTKDGVHGKKVMKWAIVPEKEGEYRLPKLSFSYFDTQKNQYAVISKTPPALKAKKGKSTELKGEAPSAAAKNLSKDESFEKKKEIKELGRDIFPVHSGSNGIILKTEWLPPSWLMLLMILIPPAVFLSVVLLIKTRENRDNAVLKADKAASILFEQCRKAGSSSDLLLATRDYFNNRFAREFGSITAEDAEKTLEEKGVPKAIISAMKDIVITLEQAEYSGIREKLDVSRIEEVVNRLERGLK